MLQGIRTDVFNVAAPIGPVTLLRKAGTVPRSADVGLGAGQSPFPVWLGLKAGGVLLPDPARAG